MVFWVTASAMRRSALRISTTGWPTPPRTPFYCDGLDMSRVAKPQTGDVVVRAKDGPTPADTSRKWNGHAGIFIGFAVKGADSAAVGMANNGTPATFSKANGDSTTKAIRFKRGPGYLVKFFRPLTTLPSP